ncbi:hypothetical protein LA080_011813 [Diaporthe eres]|nr:hypothetical protein LA080_011813 [Diaporthe eres]
MIDATGGMARNPAPRARDPASPSPPTHLYYLANAITRGHMFPSLCLKFLSTDARQKHGMNVDIGPDCVVYKPTCCRNPPNTFQYEEKQFTHYEYRAWENCSRCKPPTDDTPWEFMIDRRNQPARDDYQ